MARTGYHFLFPLAFNYPVVGCEEGTDSNFSFYAYRRESPRQ